MRLRERCTLEHPEHANISLPAGWYSVHYQRDFGPADDVGYQVQVRRVLD